MQNPARVDSGIPDPWPPLIWATYARFFTCIIACETSRFCVGAQHRCTTSWIDRLRIKAQAQASIIPTHVARVKNYEQQNVLGSKNFSTEIEFQAFSNILSLDNVFPLTAKKYLAFMLHEEWLYLSFCQNNCMRCWTSLETSKNSQKARAPSGGRSLSDWNLSQMARAKRHEEQVSLPTWRGFPKTFRTAVTNASMSNMH